MSFGGYLAYVMVWLDSLDRVVDDVNLIKFLLVNALYVVVVYVIKKSSVTIIWPKVNGSKKIWLMIGGSASWAHVIPIGALQSDSHTLVYMNFRNKPILSLTFLFNTYVNQTHSVS